MLKVDLGNTRGIKRKLDVLGRIVLPMEFRRELEMYPEDEVQIFLLKDGIYITKNVKNN